MTPAEGWVQPWRWDPKWAFIAVSDPAPTQEQGPEGAGMALVAAGHGVCGGVSSVPPWLSRVPGRWKVSFRGRFCSPIKAESTRTVCAALGQLTSRKNPAEVPDCWGLPKVGQGHGTGSSLALYV